jgi:RNA polymerase sigma factor (sigma-70 family)
VGRRGTTVAELEELYRARYERFVRAAAGITGDIERGRDVVQSAFAIAVRARRSFRREGPLEAWLWRIVVNEASRIRRSPRELDLGTVPAPTSNGHRTDAIGLQVWIAALPPRQRAAVFLRYYADLDYRSIAELLGIEVGTVSATLNAAHATLRQALEEVE